MPTEMSILRAPASRVSMASMPDAGSAGESGSSSRAHLRLSIVTATFNAERHLQGLADSISRQTFRSFEWLVLDGASRDRTLSLLRNVGDSANLLWWSEPDRGIYDAMNKGITRATGDYIIFLGADDRLAAPDTLQTIATLLDEQTTEPDVLLGRADTASHREFSSALSFKTLIVNTIHHQAVFYRRGLFDGFRYSLDYPVVADYELNLRLYLQKVRALLFDDLIAICGQEGVSKTTNESVLYRDMHRIRSKYLPRSVSLLLWAAGMLNVFRRTVRLP